MSANVDFFKKSAEFIANKTQSGNTVTAVQFENAAHQAQMSIFEKDRLIFLKTGETSDYLNSFLKSVTINPSTITGYANYPNDFMHTAGVRAYYNKIERPVELVENKAWGEVQASVLMPPTRLFPKYTEFAGEYRFLPRNVGIVLLDYLKEPVKPVWGSTVVNNQQVYNPATSVNFEWDMFAFNEVMSVYLSLVGVNLQANQLSQFSQEFKQQNNSIL